ncbi:hypothetical protein C8R43DRAFT_1025335 [Mycena crocata]|nr:hypothetical protein C8R43DRAFT_1025335 [Mycena crocata]
MVAPSSPRKATKRPRKLSEEGITPSRKRSCVSTQSASPRRQRKDADVPQLVLTSYEDELTCPICCDIFVAAHLLNPCGHSFCGDCAWQWIIKNNKTGCPVCRTRLTNDPMTPNICMDKLVGVHIQMMGYMGDISWRNGLNLAEFRGRQKCVSSDVAERSRIVVVKPPPIVWVVVSDDSEDDWDEMEI